MRYNNNNGFTNDCFFISLCTTKNDRIFSCSKETRLNFYIAEMPTIFSCPGNNETLRHILHTSREFLLLQKIESRLLTGDFVSSHFELDLKYNQ